MIGAGQNKTILSRYRLRIQGTKEEGKRVVLQGMTSTTGLSAHNGLSFLCDSMTFTQCSSEDGVYAENTKGRLINCVITQCGECGICCGAGSIDRSGR